MTSQGNRNRNYVAQGFEVLVLTWHCILCSCEYDVYLLKIKLFYFFGKIQYCAKVLSHFFILCKENEKKG